VLPAWIDELPEDDRRLILRHEAEHIRAGDPALVLVGYLVAALMPFNAPLWCLFRRLRAAVEEDCDRRVLRGRGWPEQRRYGELLIQIGQRVGSPDTRIPAPAAFAESGSHLERRIRSMYRLHPRLTRTRVAAGLAGGALLLAAACMVPGPDAPTLTEPELSDAEVAPPPPVGTGEVVSDLEFTPFTRAPELVNRAEVAEVVREEYPSLLRDAGIGGQVRVWLYVDESGAVTDLRIDETSGHQELDAAALRVAGEMAFDPALNGDEPVAVWIALPIAFGRPADEGGARASKAPPPPVDRATLGDEPTFTPYTVAPNLRNRAVTAQALEAEYPPELRGAGIGGTARVWFFIDESGGVADARLQESSGHAAIDEAALRVARTMEFSPALNRDAPVPVWVAFPITFMVR
jgi:TonB family protein